MITLNDVAKKAGVSKSTVSRTLNEDPSLSITKQTKERIMKAVDELGYVHKHSRVSTATYQIAVIHKEAHYRNPGDNAFYLAVRYGIESMCHRLRVNCSFLLSTMLKELPLNLDGVIINGNYSKEQMEEIMEAIGDTPAVIVGRLNFAPADKDWITYDVQDAVWIALDHLVQRGKKSFLYVGGRDSEETPSCLKKIFYYREYIAEHPGLCSIGEIEGDHGTESGYQMMNAWLEEGNPLPDAVFASHDPTAVGVVRALAEHGISIPGKLAVMGINGDSICKLTVPILTTVTVHAENTGREAVKVLLDKIANKYTTARKIIFRAELIPGQST